MKCQASKDNYRVWWIHPESDSEGHDTNIEVEEI